MSLLSLTMASLILAQSPNSSYLFENNWVVVLLGSIKSMKKSSIRDISEFSNQNEPLALGAVLVIDQCTFFADFPMGIWENSPAMGQSYRPVKLEIALEVWRTVGRRFKTEDSSLNAVLRPSEIRTILNIRIVVVVSEGPPRALPVDLCTTTFFDHLDNRTDFQ